MILQGVEIVYFSEEEFTDVHSMHLPLLMELDRLRLYTGRPIGVHESNPVPSPRSIHVPDSYHYKGRAVDVFTNNYPLWEFFLAATRLKFTGIGVYPYWHRPGLHLEMGDDPNALRKYWWRDINGNYRAISIYDLQEVFTIPVVAGI